MKYTLKESMSEYAKKAWMLGQIMQSMNDESAYYGSWLYIWPDDETMEDCEYDFGDEISYNELEASFIPKYKRCHSGGLFNASKDVVDAAHEWDKKLGLEPIVNIEKSSLHEDADVEEPVADHEPTVEEPAEPSVEDAKADITIVEEEPTDPIADAAREVMTAYQNANKWLDSVKEFLYITVNCPFFSSFVHKLAHTMPERFDKFGDILHTVDMEIPYPATAELATRPADISEAFTVIFNVLNDIKTALNKFIAITDADAHGMACAAETLLNDIEGEFPMLYRLSKKWADCSGDSVAFDKYVCQYIDHKDDLLENKRGTKMIKRNINEDVDIDWRDVEWDEPVNEAAECKKFVVKNITNDRYLDAMGNVVTRDIKKAMKFDSEEAAEKELNPDGKFKNWADTFEIVCIE